VLEDGNASSKYDTGIIKHGQRHHEQGPGDLLGMHGNDIRNATGSGSVTRDENLVSATPQRVKTLPGGLRLSAPFWYYHILFNSRGRLVDEEDDSTKHRIQCL